MCHGGLRGGADGSGGSCSKTTHSGLIRAVADNTLIIKQKSILPVSKTRQDKLLFRSLSGAYPPPLESGFVSSCSAATSPSWTSAAPAPLLSATGFRLRPSSVLHDDLRCCHRRVRPRRQDELAYATGPFSVPNCPARPSRTTDDLILYGAVGCAATVPHRAHC